MSYTKTMPKGDKLPRNYNLVEAQRVARNRMKIEKEADAEDMRAWNSSFIRPGRGRLS